jgi:hypothetical protein
MAGSDRPQLRLTLEAGEDNRPILKVGGSDSDSEVPLVLTAQQAGEVGRALLAASAVCSSGVKQSPGIPIRDCRLPVLKWGAGHSKDEGLPVLVLEILGGTQITFQFDRELAADCAHALLAAAV